MKSTFLCALILRCEAPGPVAAWYKEILRLPLEERDHEFSCLLGQVHFAIHGLQKGQLPTTNVELGIYVANVDEFVKQLKSKSIELADPVRDYPWARAGQVKDPLGNTVYLMQLPKSSIRELGKLVARELDV
jgi:hypothetical protein